jgi:ADP-heptose:LPS heptosyltransferase
MSLSALQRFRPLYWGLRRDPWLVLHLMAVLAGFAANATRLTLGIGWPGHRRPRVAISLIEHMGDIVAAEPISRLARQWYPDARIYWVTRVAYASLPQTYSVVDQVVTVGCLTEWMLLRRAGLFDVVWDLHFDGRHCWRCDIPQVNPGVSVNMDDYYHHGCLLDAQCVSAGLPRLDEGPTIKPPPTAVATVDSLSLPSHFVVFHGVSNDPRRDWSAEKWRELIDHILAARPVTVVEVGLKPLVIRNDSTRQLSLCGEPNMLETAEVIKRADLFIGIDSGPAHLANAVGTPGVIILGSFQDFLKYTPYSGSYANGSNADLVRAPHGPAANVPVEAVFSAVMERLRREPVA